MDFKAWIQQNFGDLLKGMKNTPNNNLVKPVGTSNITNNNTVNNGQAQVNPVVNGVKNQVNNTISPVKPNTQMQGSNIDMKKIHADVMKDLTQKLSRAIQGIK